MKSKFLKGKKLSKISIISDLTNKQNQCDLKQRVDEFLAKEYQHLGQRR